MSKLKMHLIDLELSGSGYLLQTDTHNILFDISHQQGTGLLVNYLQELNITHLDLIVITHPHRDHNGDAGGGISPFLDNFVVSEVWCNGFPHPLWYDGVNDSPSTDVSIASFRGTEQLFNQLFPNGFNSSTNIHDYPTVTGSSVVPYREPKRGDVFAYGDLTLKVLHPSRPLTNFDYLTSPRENTCSLVIQAEFKGKKLMLTGDLLSGVNGETSIINAFDNETLKSDLLYLGHHGYDSSNDSTWLDAINPKIAVVQTRTPNQPTQRILNELNNRNILLYYVKDTVDKYVIEFDENSILVNGKSIYASINKKEIVKNINNDIQKFIAVKKKNGVLIQSNIIS